MNTFWGFEVKGKAKYALDTDDNSYVMVTTIVIGDIQSDTEGEIVANLQTVVEDQDMPVSRTVSLAKLRPGVCENVMASIQFSPLDLVEFENKGENSVYISGYFVPIIDIEEEEEEEEEIDQKIGRNLRDVLKRI